MYSKNSVFRNRRMLFFYITFSLLSYYQIHLREYIFLFAPEAIMKDMRAP